MISLQYINDEELVMFFRMGEPQHKKSTNTGQRPLSNLQVLVDGRQLVGDCAIGGHTLQTVSTLNSRFTVPC
jgi:hypothetical protein